MDLPIRETVFPVSLKGLLEGDSGTGTIVREGFNYDLHWSASRITQGTP